MRCINGTGNLKALRAGAFVHYQRGMESKLPVPKKKGDIVMLRPLGANVVVKADAVEEKTKSGIFIPDTASKEKPMQGTVLAVGNGDR